MPDDVRFVGMVTAADAHVHKFKNIQKRFLKRIMLNPVMYPSNLTFSKSAVLDIRYKLYNLLPNFIKEGMTLES